MYIHVMRDNKRAIKFNLFRGYKLEEGQETVLNQLYSLAKEDAKNNKKINQFRKIFS